MANGSKYEINLQFNADTSSVSKELDKLQGKLKQLSEGQGVIGKMSITKDVNDAMNAAAKLQTILKNSRLDSGKLDIVSFQDNLAKAGLTVEDLSRHFGSLGAQGAKAFDQLTQSVMTAENPMRRTSTLLTNFATTLKNTAKWQISSSILHGFMSSVQGAYRYTQDLNESLNNIRIVSKQNTDQMAAFAKEANEAAKSLSVTTTAYTDAALIFYQQGLKGEEVTERTDVVAKMANVTKDSVDEVSSYMTAIWNNFDDGSESLEHYADVITGLGAATASSSAEIAAGLEKFAAVADTVGLSYDYATSALATVVAQTRQSADTVGTAFKTLFARIEGLKLGETLDDGVDLNKYSEALNKVGVSVLDANGQLRDMDSILDDLGARWESLDKASQVALAQTVAGTRQYNQLVALLDNWEKVQENLEVARSSDGELQSQADIYAESWEAAEKRVKAAAQGIYSSLIDEDFFIKLDNGLASVLNFVSKIIDSLGGIKSLWPMLFTIFGKLFGGELNLGFSNVFKNLYSQTQAALQQIEAFRKKISNENFDLSVTYDNKAVEFFEAEYKRVNKEITELQTRLKGMNAETAEAAQAEIDSVVARLANLKNYLEGLIQKEAELKQQVSSGMTEVARQFDGTIVPQNNKITPTGGSQLSPNNGYFDDSGQLKNVEEEAVRVDGVLQDLQRDFQTMGDGIVQYFAKMKTALDEGTMTTEEAQRAIQGMGELVSQVSGQKLTLVEPEEYEKISELFNNIEAGSETASQDIIKLTNLFADLLSEAKEFSAEDIEALSAINPQMKKFLENLMKTVNELGKTKAGMEEVARAARETATSVQQSTPQGGGQQEAPKAIVPNIDLSKTVVQASQFAMFLTQINNLTEQLNDNTKSWGEKCLSIVTSLGMMGFSLKGSLGFIQNILIGTGKLTEKIIEHLGLNTANLLVEKDKAKAEQESAAAQTVTTEQTEEELVANTANLGVEKEKNVVEAGEQVGKTGVGKKIGGAFSSLGTKLTSKGAGAGAAAAGGEGAAAGLTGAAATVAGVAAAVLAVVVVSAVIAKIAHEVAKSNAIKNFAEKAKRQDKAQEEVEKSAKKYEDATTAYEDFHDVFASGTASLAELKTSALQAAAATNDQRIAAIALTGSFQDLDNYLANNLLNEQDEHLKKLNESNNLSESTIQSGLIAAAREKYLTVKGNDFDIYGLNHTDKNGNNSDDQLKRLLQDVSGEDLEWGHISTERLAQVLMGQTSNGMTSDEFLNELRNIVNLGGAGSKGAQQILDWASSEQVNEYLDQYKQNLDEIQSIGLEYAFTKSLIGQKEVQSAQEYEQVLEKIRETAKEKGVDINAEDFEDTLNTMAATYSELEKYAGAHAIAFQIIDIKPECEKQLETLESQIADFSNSERSWIALHPYIAADYTTDEGINLDELQPIIDYNENKNRYDTLKDITNSFDPSKGFDDKTKEILNQMGFNTFQSVEVLYQQILDEQEKLYDKLQNDLPKAQDLVLKKESDYTKDLYFHEDYSEYGDQSELIKQYYDGIRISIENEGKQTEETIKQQNQALIDAMFNKGPNGSIVDTGEFQKLREQFNLTADEATNEDWTDTSDRFKEAWEQEIENLTNDFENSGETIERYLEGIKRTHGETTAAMVKANISMNKSLDEHLDHWHDYENVVTETTEAVAKTTAEKLKDAENSVKNCSNSLDTIQSAYKDLYAAMKEYNEDGTMSLDTIQSLIKLGPQYIQFLIDENGQFKLNEQAIQAATEATYRKMEADQAAVLMAQLKIIQEGNVESQEYKNVIAAYASKAALDAMGLSMDGVIKYAQSMSSTLPGAAEAINGITAAAQAFKNVFAAGEKGLTTNFPKFMGVSSKGGGGGKGKTKETKDLKEYADEFDRFYPYQKVIDDLADAMDDLSKAQEHMAGGELVGALRKQNRLLQEQKKAYQDLAKEQKAYQKEMQMDLAKYGVSFDTFSGNIVNYADATNQALEQYNAAIEKYNKSAQSDADKKALEAVEKEYEKFKKLLSNYQNILTEIQDTENKLDDIYYETIANNLKEFEIMVQVKLDIGEARRMVNDFLSEINKNFKTLKKSTKEWLDIFDTALKNAHTYIDGDLGTINVDLDALNKVKNAIDTGDYGHEGAMFASETEAITKYKELAEQLKDDAQALYELYRDAWDDYLDAVDEAIEEWEEIIDSFDEIQDTLDHYEKIIDLLKGTDTDERYELLAQTYQKEIELSLAKQATLRKQIETLEKEYKQLIKAGADENDEDVQRVKKAIEDANKSLQDAIGDYLDIIEKKLENAIEIAKRTLEKSMFGVTLDHVKEEWEDAKKEADKYYDSVSRIYELDKLKGNYTDVINDTKSLKLKKQLGDLQEKELERLAKKEKLSKADIEIAQKRLEVEQARIALEEAQNNKSSMRLRRDSQGNWSYQFVADEENIEDKEQNLNDKIESWRQAAIDARQSVQEEWLAMFEEYENKYLEIIEATRGNEEERDRQLAELKASYIEKEKLLRQEAYDYDIIIGNATTMELGALYIQDASNYENMTEYEKSLIDDLNAHGISSYDALFQNSLDKYDLLDSKAEEVMQNGIEWWDIASMNAIEKTNNVEEVLNEFFENLQRAIDEYDEAIARSEEASGIAWSNVGDAVEDVGNKIDEVTDKVEDCVDRTDALSDFRERLNEIEEAWNSVKDAITDALSELENYLSKLLEVKEMQDVVRQNATDASAPDFGSGIGGGSGGNDGSSGGGGNANSDTPTFKAEVVTTTDRSGMKTHNVIIKKNLNGSTTMRHYGSYGVDSSKANQEASYLNQRFRNGYVPFKTGGYTGEWNNGDTDGRLAVLHQKELILNQTDTKNILDAVQAIRGAGSGYGISEAISRAAAETVDIMSNSIDMITHTVTEATHAVVESIMAAAHSGTLEQNVHIDASFPDATDRYEIELAFDNLVNIASQRILETR